MAATGSRKPDRRARLLPGLRLRCCDKAVLPSAMHSGAGRPGCGPLRGRAASRATAVGVLPGPAPGGARAHGPSALGHRRYLARRTGGIPENSRKKLVSRPAVTLCADHGPTTCIDTITISHLAGRCDDAWDRCGGRYRWTPRSPTQVSLSAPVRRPSAASWPALPVRGPLRPSPGRVRARRRPGPARPGGQARPLVRCRATTRP